MSSSNEPGHTVPSHSWRNWLPRVLLESVFIVFSVLLALALDQWQERRDRSSRALVALESIRAELQINRESIARARDNHLAMRDSLTQYAERQELPPSRIYLRGVFNPGMTHATAWDAAREAGVTADFPYDLLLALSRVYDRQARYRSLGDALVQDLMIQVRREGREPVLRDRPASLMSLQEDFATRESALLQAYDGVLASLSSRAR